jgi:hypothetical protein
LREEYRVRKTKHGHGKLWAVDKLTKLGTPYYTNQSRYFETEEKAEAYKERMEKEDWELLEDFISNVRTAITFWFLKTRKWNENWLCFSLLDYETALLKKTLDVISAKRKAI